jgi:hypothetical protein
MLIWAPEKLVSIFTALFGYTKFPNDLSEANLLRWYKENLGSDIVVPAIYLPRLDNVLTIIAAYRGHHAIANMAMAM